jgi:hypothetical protein
VPQPAQTVEGQAGKGSMLQEATYGFKYIFNRRSLLGLLLFFVCLNFIIGLSVSLFAPFILSRTGNNSAALGSAQSAAAIGGVIGGLLIGLWGGFKRRMHSILLGEALTGLFCLLLFGLGRSLAAWVIVSVIGGIFPSFTNVESRSRCAGAGVLCPAHDCLEHGTSHPNPGWRAGRLRDRAGHAITDLAGISLWSPGRRWTWLGNGRPIYPHRDRLYARRRNCFPVCSGRAQPGRSATRPRPDAKAGTRSTGIEMLWVLKAQSIWHRSFGSKKL